MTALLFSGEGIADRARKLTETLAWLRLCAVAGQTATVVIVALGLDIVIEIVPLTLGISVLLAFALFAFWRLRQPWPVHPLEAFGHIAVDTAVLTWLLYFSGGSTNPFVSLLVMPIALAAAALPLRYVTAVAVIAALCYLTLVSWNVPLPPFHHIENGQSNPYLIGSVANFVIIAAMLAYFISRLARSLREREVQVRRERERALRDEGILAIATQAAGTAHELNTPLSTIRTLLTELRRDHGGPSALADDLDLLSGQADRCRDILRELVALGSRQLTGTPERLALSRFIDECEDQFRLLRPEVQLQIDVEPDAAKKEIDAAPSLRHALINLLSNAADASLDAGSARIELAAAANSGLAEFRIRDHGAGPAPARGTAFQTSKRDGLGLGLALAHATAERLGGTLHAQSMTDGGLQQRLRIPWATGQEAA